MKRETEPGSETLWCEKKWDDAQCPKYEQKNNIIGSENDQETDIGVRKDTPF
jgi:hypothetical protein